MSRTNYEITTSDGKIYYVFHSEALDALSRGNECGTKFILAYEGEYWNDEDNMGWYVDEDWEMGTVDCYPPKYININQIVSFELC